MQIVVFIQSHFEKRGQQTVEKESVNTQTLKRATFFL